ncbi:MAG: ferritin-like domain-containing protein [Burkholderiales bacterium]
MKTRVTSYLTDALSHEMGIVQQYLAQSRLCALLGLPEEGYFRREAGEELEHAAQLIEVLLKLGVSPNATRLASVRPGRNLFEMLSIDRQLEMEAIRLYGEAADYCERFGDAAMAGFFHGLMRDEEHHLGELDRMLASLKGKEQ